LVSTDRSEAGKVIPQQALAARFKTDHVLSGGEDDLPDRDVAGLPDGFAEIWSEWRHILHSTQAAERAPHVTEVIVGMNVFFQHVQNLNIGVRSPRSFYQYTLQSGGPRPALPFCVTSRGADAPASVLEDVGSDLQIKSPQAVVNVDRQKAAALGLTAERIRNTLYNSFGSRQSRRSTRRATITP
jgi:multidrug efflux pump subunit AcrB